MEEITMKLVNGFKLMEYAKRNNFVLPASIQQTLR